MFAVTDDARSLINHMLDKVDAEPNEVVRLVPSKEGLRPRLSWALPSDKTYVYQERVVLAVAPPLHQRLDEENKKLDAVATEAGSQLEIKNLNEGD
ncbi:MAG: hypothetical protein R3236_00190 [Phycisphaeraceae bacterium]|nr:hypothetical protein [Phycisphaeraceae bacterium]